jgi:hypothetical protein
MAAVCLNISDILQKIICPQAAIAVDSTVAMMRAAKPPIPKISPFFTEKKISCVTCAAA